MEIESPGGGRVRLVASEPGRDVKTYRRDRILWSLLLLGAVMGFGGLAPLLAFLFGLDPLQLVDGLRDPTQAVGYAAIVTIGLGAGISLLLDALTRCRVVIFERGIVLPKGMLMGDGKEIFLPYSNVNRIEFVPLGEHQLMNIHTGKRITQISMSSLEPAEEARGWLRGLPQASQAPNGAA